MSGYIDFSKVYDSLMIDANYEKRANYVVSLFEKFSKKPKLLLDVGCGTGSFIKEFSGIGIDCIGVDPSDDMLLIAKEKCPDALFLNQSAQELDLYGTVDGAVSLMDSINHIIEREELSKAFKKISLFMERDSVFIFDINSEYKHREVLGDNAFVFENDGVFCAWQNYTDDELLTEINLDFFCKSVNGQYDRFSEDFFERAYSKDVIKEELNNAGFEIVAIFDDLSFETPNPYSERIFYVARKV